jgi:hypothetical protein
LTDAPKPARSEIEPVESEDRAMCGRVLLPKMAPRRTALVVTIAAAESDPTLIGG